VEVPEGIIELTVVSVVGFIFKVVFGLIEKNKQISDDENLRLREEIKELRKDSRQEHERHRQHENTLFEKDANRREQIAYQKGVADAKKEGKKGG
jgi:flagellar biosynthesis/type III secretory pathway protein FliH